jgi:hypothetical protein
MMDLISGKPLTTKEKMDLSRVLQVMALDEIAAKAKPQPDHMIYHGGTSIATTHGSSRWSEDLDFVVTSDLMRSLGGVRPRVEKALQLRMKTLMPGAKIELQDKTGTDEGNPEVGKVDRWLLRWEHPKRRGAIRVKIEFFVTVPESIPAYSVTISTPRSKGIMATASLPTADVRSLWADKILAISARESIKWRDLYDLSYLSEQMSASGFDRSEALGDLKISADIYKSSLEKIRTGLERDVVVDGLVDSAGYEADMKKWFSDAEFKAMIASGAFRGHLERASEEVERARDIINDIDNDCDGPSL